MMFESSGEPVRDTVETRARVPRTHAVIATVVLAVLWLMFSGKLDEEHLSFGVISLVVVLLLSYHLLASRSRPAENDFLSRVNWGKAVVYPFWLLWQVVLANIQVAIMVLRPRLDIHPCLIRVPFPSRSSVSKTVLGNSITLTPGTYTIQVAGDDLLIHAIDPESAGSLFDASFQKRVAEVFGEPPPAPAEVTEAFLEEHESVR